MIIGITGPTGAGKTTVLKVLQGMGFGVIDCDGVYHRLLGESREMLGAIEARFPGTAVGGALDRKKLGALVFSDGAALSELNDITHPFVLREVDRLTAAPGNYAIDAIALFEGGEAEKCDCTVAVTAPREARIRRIMLREGIDRAYAEKRVDAQKSDAYFREKCDFELVNSYRTAAELEARAEVFFNKIIKGENPMSEEKNELLYTKKHVLDLITDEEKAASDAYAEDYKSFLRAAKTERLAVKEAVRLAEAAGFKPFDRSEKLTAGDRIYKSVRGKALFLAVIGERRLDEGVMICAAHIDSPRIDLKQVPLMEREDVAYFKTHYYGGIRKYQWLSIPLALHGVVVRRDGTSVEVNIGEDAGDPTFVITDLLPHLAAKQGQQPLNTAIPGENLNLIIGSLPVKEEEGKDRVKKAVMTILNEKYGIIEEDFLSAELEIVPALEPRDVGFDRSFIASYGQDDRVCAYAELRAIMETERPGYTAVCVLADKEEIGSVGVTGMQSDAFECFMEDLCEKDGSKLRHVFEKALCVSADVTVGYDPTWPEVSEKQNSTLMNCGLGICKYTGARGKSGCNDASAETVGRVRRIFNDNGVIWQTGELGKVDEGGGGTVAAYMGNRGIDTVDAGTPVLAMHSPYELVSKLDAYMTYKGMKAVYSAK